MARTSAWPFGTDADQDDPLTALRVPAVSSFNPEWRYVAAYLKPAADGVPDYLAGPPFASNERPTGREAQMLASFIREYLEHWFHEGYRTQLAERPLDVDSGCPTWVFIKYGPDDWGYRVGTWQSAAFVPEAPAARERLGEQAVGPLTLEQVMDRVRTITGDEPLPRWTEWKAEHPDVFGPCPRCKGSGIDPEHTAAENYGDVVRELPEPCAHCQLVSA
ncbi:hypothetical protein ACH4F6_37995 [Streptomyces sp. NPDC017936]|uniref:hypothetical protein n=1 Tax=Streptomyces sp. NPDC017936 TaxID=3365016 RepID=UPI0037AEF0E4